MAEVVAFGGEEEEHHSDTKTFSVTSTGAADMKIDGFSQKVTSCRPGTVFEVGNPIASYNIVNLGGASDKSYVKYLYRTAGETTWHELDMAESLEIGPGDTATGMTLPLFVKWACPAAGITIEFAIKVWGKDTESEPPDPA